MTAFALMIGLFLLTGLAISKATEIWLEWIGRMNDEYERRHRQCKCDMH